MITEDERTWLLYLAIYSDQSKMGNIPRRVKLRCRDAGWAFWNGPARTWHITPAGRAALKEAGDG